MKKEGHPTYQDILFVDTATGTKFVCGAAMEPAEKEVFEGKEYPVYRAPITSASHPFYTGSQGFIDTEGRVDKFRNKYTKKAPAAKKEAAAEDKKVAVKPKKKKTDK